MIGLVLVLLVGVVAVVMATGDDGDDDGDRTEAAKRDENGDTDPSEPPATATPSENDGGEGGDDSPPSPSTAPQPEATDPPPAPTTSTTPRAPAQAAVGECVQVTENGNLLGKGSCTDGAAPYKVTAIVDPGDGCPAGSTRSGDYRLCLELNVVESYCYKFPRNENGGLGGWVTPAPTCRASGTVHVIDIVPGASSGDACTRQYEWNYWYGISAPQMVVCVMEY